MKPRTHFGPSILIGLYSRDGEFTAESRPFKDYEASIREMVLREVSLQETEEPLLLHFRNLDHWLLMTTQSFAWQRGKVRQYPFTELLNAEFVFSRAGKIWHKKDVSLVEVIMKDGEHYDIEVDPGQSCFGWYRILSFVARGWRKTSAPKSCQQSMVES